MNKSSDPAYLSAREAASELAVSPATLYAYVSRGLIRSEPTPDTRGRRYRADDVRALRSRRAPPPEQAQSAGPALAWGTPVLDSAITLITNDGLFYRGASAVALSESATFEHVATLLWDAAGHDPFAEADDGGADPSLAAAIAAVAPMKALNRAAAILPLAGDLDGAAHNRTQVGRAITGARIVRLTARLIAGTAPSREPIHRVVARALAPNRKGADELVRRTLVLLADHELNASTFAARVIASTGANLYDVVAGGIAALKGPRHGGASLRAARLVAAFVHGDLTREVRERTVLGERFAGFGHPLYPNGDPRAVSLMKALAAAGADRRLVIDAPRAIVEATGEVPNIDYALAVMTHTLGMPAGTEVAMFALARTAGWIAHGIEQNATGALIRPRARYTGPAPKTES